MNKKVYHKESIFINHIIIICIQNKELIQMDKKKTKNLAIKWAKVIYKQFTKDNSKWPISISIEMFNLINN